VGHTVGLLGDIRKTQNIFHMYSDEVIEIAEERLFEATFGKGH